MNLLKSFGKMFVESILETMEEGVEDSRDSSYNFGSVDDFSNCYRLNSEDDIATNLEGKNSTDNGGQWIRMLSKE